MIQGSICCLTHGMHAGEPDNETTAMVLYSDNAEAVEWINMCWRKVGRLPSGPLMRNYTWSTLAEHLM